MSRSWKWDFEDRPVPAEVPTPARPDASDAARRAQLTHRRRITALGLALALFAVALAAALSGGGHSRPSSVSPSRAGGTRARAGSPGGGLHHSVAPNKAVGAVLAYTPFVRAGGEQGHDVALTFDDGPGPYTPGVLSVLERADVPATFFAIGKMERYFSASTVREIHDGDVVGDHTETHPMMAQLSAHEQHEELFEQIARIELLEGPKPRLFRPPYGSFNATTLHELKALHLLMVLWSVDAGDYMRPGVPAIVDRVLAGARPGAIVLMHDGGGDRSQTIASLPLIISKLRARGFHLVTVPQLLADDPPPAGLPLPPNLSGD